MTDVVSKKTNAGPINADRLKSFISRIEKMEEEQAALAGDKRDIYSEAKGVGYDVKTMRKVIALRKMDAADRDEQETLLDVYMHALGMVDRIDSRIAAGELTRVIAAEEGTSKSTVHRRVPKVKAQTDTPKMGHKVDVISPPEVEALPAHDAETGEIKESTASPEQGAASSSSPPDDAPHADRTEAPAATPVPDGGVGAGTSSRAAGDMAMQESGQPPSAEPDPNAGAAGGADAPALITQSCEPCPVSAATGAAKGNGLPSEKGEAADSPAARRHTSDDALAPALGTSQCANGVAPGSQDLFQRITGAFPTTKPAEDDDLTIPTFLDRRKQSVPA